MPGLLACVCLLTFGPVADCADCLLGALAGTGVCLGALPVARQVALVAYAPVAGDGSEAADVLCNLSSQVTFHQEVVLKNLKNGRDVCVSQAACWRHWIDFGHFADFVGSGWPNAVEIR